MDEYKKYLADRLLSDEQPITYRLLSRALDIHVNTAKEMLYDYHAYQNEQKPGSIHATYLISGRKTVAKSEQNGDVEMSSSMPDQDPVYEDVPTTTLTLVGEEKLQDTLADYQDATSIHVYSLAPHPQRDLALLSDMSKALSEYTIKEQETKKYGTIANPYVRRRDRKARQKAPAPGASKSTKPQPTKSQPAPVKPEPAAAQVKQEAPPDPPKQSAAPSGSTKAAAPPAKKATTGGIMQSFAKAASKPPKKPKEEPKKEEDTSMALSDDGEADDDDVVSSKKPANGNDTGRKSRKEREAELRRMMEEEEDEEEEGDQEKEEDDPADREMEDAPEPEPEPEPAAKDKKDEGPSEVVASTENGRRRGKRRVMQKRRIMDDQGYMVTIQEPGWESFSEDEAPPPAKKATPAPAPSSTGEKEKAKKPAAKGQGNIMSFFAKK